MYLEMISRCYDNSCNTRRTPAPHPSLHRRSIMKKRVTLGKTLRKVVTSVESLFQLQKDIDEGVGTRA